MPEPKIHLHTADNLIKYLKNHPDNLSKNSFYPPFNDDVNETKCDFLIECIHELVSNGKYPYHASVWELAREKLGYEKMDYYYWWENQRQFSYELKLLYILVCRASDYRHSDDLIAEGYNPLTDEFVNQAYLLGAKIKTVAGNEPYNIKMINDKLYVVPKYSRNKAIRIEGQPAKMVFKNK